MASKSTIPRQKEGRRKTSELFPDDVKKFIVTLKKNNRPYIEIVDEAKKEFPGLDVKLHHCREIVLSESAHVSLTIEEKYQIVRLKDEGQHTWKQIADMFNIRPKRAQDIYRKNKDKIVDYRNACIGVKATAKVNFISVVYLPNLICLFCQAITKKRTPIHELTDTAVLHWIFEENRKGGKISESMVKERALSYFESFSRQVQVPVDWTNVKFTASNGWLHRFKKDNKLKSYKLYGESRLVDQHEVSLFVEFLRATIIMEDYRPEQIWNVDETGLFWKKTPDRTIASIQDSRSKVLKGSKECKKRVTLLLGKSYLSLACFICLIQN